jgi:hypothetical protein
LVQALQDLAVLFFHLPLSRLKVKKQEEKKKERCLKKEGFNFFQFFFFQSNTQGIPLVDSPHDGRLRLSREKKKKKEKKRKEEKKK